MLEASNVLCACDDSTSLGTQLLEGHEPALLFVPEHEAHAPEALEQGDTADGSELLVVAEHFRQAIERDSAR